MYGVVFCCTVCLAVIALHNHWEKKEITMKGKINDFSLLYKAIVVTCTLENTGNFNFLFIIMQ